jgi:energy-coupling factor transporter ATP-binding protein EcfA2
VVHLEDVTVATPNYSTVLVEKLGLELAPGGSLLVMGPSGCGKTSLLRAIGGLWTAGKGSISRPAPGKLLVRLCLLYNLGEACLLGSVVRRHMQLTRLICTSHMRACLHI